MGSRRHGSQYTPHMPSMEISSTSSSSVSATSSASVGTSAGASAPAFSVLMRGRLPCRRPRARPRRHDHWKYASIPCQSVPQPAPGISSPPEMTSSGGPDRGAPGEPLPCRSPVPAGTRLRPDPGLLSLAGGTVLVGGAPLRLLRLGPRGAALASGWWDGEPVPGRPAAQKLARRLLDAGLAHPDPAGGPPGPSPDEVTAVIPVRDRPAELARCLAGL